MSVLMLFYVNTVKSKSNYNKKYTKNYIIIFVYNVNFMKHLTILERTNIVILYKKNKWLSIKIAKE
jgi:hypothetical protein